MQRILAPCRIILRQRDFRVLLVCNLLLGLAFSFVGPFFSMFGTIEVGMSPLLFGVFMTTNSLGAVALSTALAHWSDTRCSRRAILILGSLCGVAGYTAFAFLRDPLWLTVIGATVLGISSITFSQLFAHAREVIRRADVPQEDTPLYMNVFRMFIALAWTIGPAIGAWIMVRYSYRGMFLAAAGVYLVFLLAVLRYIPALPPAPAAQAAARIPLRQALARADLLAYFAGFTLVYAAATMGMMNLPLLILKTLGGSEQQVGIAYCVAPVFELPFMFFFGMLASKGDQARIIRTGVTLAVVYYALLTLVGAPWQVYPLQILSAAITAVTMGVAITFFQSYLPDLPGTATNLYSNASRIGSTIGYLLFGTLATGFGHRTVFHVCAALSLIALVLMYAYRHPSVVRLGDKRGPDSSPIAG